MTIFAKRKAAPKRAATPPVDPAWLTTAKDLMAKFAKDHTLVLSATERQLSAAFEIACFQALLYFYKKQGYTPTLEHLHEGEYRYLTSPSGNPANFSFVRLTGSDGEFEVRQQVRIESHVDPDIRFTPDLVVLVKDATINAEILKDFAQGKRKLFSVKSSQVVAAHECKSMNPFPELMVNFIGMLVTAHAWYPNGPQVADAAMGHLAPTLFVGGTARALHLKMIKALETAYRLNIVVGMHSGTWELKSAQRRLSWRAAALGPALPTAQAVAAPVPQ
ncbi:hypothetical protein [Hydrogenophaga sp.]|uniref:hypothetical protein n=1 Tax=Hydrogenophaga sp. TaxID=1904254 RepID=UPI002601DD74|nr:hypothetical protein [Hydrogenophaga sp.]MDM7948285.1 hypothetical protein [Hydrogenophaga sp.]